MASSSSTFVSIRGLDYHVRTWGNPAARKLFLLHGWMDVSASFQFLVDALTEPRFVLAPDWRGFGLSAVPQDGYWFPDYVADLDALARTLAPGEPIDVAGHSLGANVAMLYAGLRPANVAHVAALDGFGLRDESPERAPAKFSAWLDAQVTPPAFAVYNDMSAVADRLQKNNGRLSRQQAEFLAPHWAEVGADGIARLRADGRHKQPFPTTYRLADTFAIWHRITAPVLWIAAADSHIGTWIAGGGDAAGEVARRHAQVPNGDLVIVPDAGHMLHHDQPHAVAAHLENFLAGRALT